MNRTRPVVVGVADKQECAVAFALREADRAGSELVVVHSTGIPIQAYDAYSATTVITALREAGQGVLDLTRELVDRLDHTAPVRYVLSTSAPVDALQLEAQEARMLVVGADDLSWFERTIGGAVTAHLVRHSRVPVVVVPESDHGQPGAGVVVTLDGDSAARGPLQFAFEAARVRGGALEVLHATPPGTSEADNEAARAAISEVLAGWRSEFPEVEVRTEFVRARPSDACLDAAAEASLIVLGRPSGRVAPFALARPVAGEVVRRSTCPVAVIPLDFGGDR